MYVVEVSNPRLANDSAYERWECANAAILGAQIESESGLSAGEAAGAAYEVAVLGESFEHVDEETGRTVTAWRKVPAEVAA